MKKIFYFIVLIFLTLQSNAQILDEYMAKKLAELPMESINKEYPNKTGHVFKDSSDINKSPRDLHPSFYGCFDWHSSVHGHWMLLRLLRIYPNIDNNKHIENILDNSFLPEKILAEVKYFQKNKLFERTYGWAWLLKLDEELSRLNTEKSKDWKKSLKPLVNIIVRYWKEYIPKQTYPDRTGVHTNSAFALGFAIDWARNSGDIEFERMLTEKANSFYASERNTPAYLEPNGSDFFSPSLEIAGLISRIMDAKEYKSWFRRFMPKKGLENISQIPDVSDVDDYYTVHLVGLSFSRAWNMRLIADRLPYGNRYKKSLEETASKLIKNALPLVFKSNYGGGHWLASFAVYSMTN